jgi:hypothetical protein
LIESDEGFSVEVIGRTGLLYAEGARRLQIYSELLTGPHGRVIYTTDVIIRWHPPYDGESIDETHRTLIIENIKRAFLFQGYEIEVI